MSRDRCYFGWPKSTDTKWLLEDSIKNWFIELFVQLFTVGEDIEYWLVIGSTEKDKRSKILTCGRTSTKHLLRIDGNLKGY